MSTSSGRDADKYCTRCDHSLNEHTHQRDSKCKKCKRMFEICQAGLHGIENSGGWRLCFIPCSCSKKFWPDKAKAAKPLEPHEYKIGHPGYRALYEDDATFDDSKADADQPEDSFATPQKTSSSAVQGGHSRADSGGSEDPLAWSPNTYQQRTVSMAELVGDLNNTHIDDPGSTTAEGFSGKRVWCDWYWNDEHKCEARYRENPAVEGGWEYEYRQVLKIGEWCDWYWCDEHKCEARYRENPAVEGGWEYEYRSVDTTASSAKPSKSSSSGRKHGKGKARG